MALFDENERGDEKENESAESTHSIIIPPPLPDDSETEHEENEQF